MGSSFLKVAAGRWWGRVMLPLMLAVAVGCGAKRPVEVYPPASSRDAIQRARDILELYAQGQPVGSEAIGFPVLVADVRAVDAAVAETLDRGLDAIAKNPAVARGTASRLLATLPGSAAAAAAAAGLGPAP